MLSRTTFRLLLITIVLYACYLFSPVLYLRFEIANQIERLTAKSEQLKNDEIERNLSSFINQMGQRIEVKRITVQRNQAKIGLEYIQTVCFVHDWDKSCLLRIDHKL